MANRPVYVPFEKAPFVNVYMPSFDWNKGLSVQQKKKNVTALHAAYNRRFPQHKVLEISSKSEIDLGISLSAFNLKKFVPQLGKSVPLECVFQGGKVFAAGGPYTDLYEKTSREAKKDERLKTSGSVRSFYFDGKNFPTTPKTAFYDWLYINALLENPDLAQAVMEYDAFTDIEFNPEKSLNCQAKAAALFVQLNRMGLVQQCRDFDEFIRLTAR